MRNWVLYRKTNKDELLLYCVLKAMETHVLYRYHVEKGHVARNKMLDLISGSNRFPNMTGKVSGHIRNYLKCKAYSDKHGKQEGLLNNIPKSSDPFDVIHIDHYGPVDNGKQLRHVLVVIDVGAKYVMLYPTKTTRTKEVVAHMKDYFRSYSRPRCVVSDRGTAFTSAEFRLFLMERGIRHVKIVTGSSQANGQVERFNRSIGPMLAKLVRPYDGVYWDYVLDSVEYALNNTVNRSVGECPRVLFFGQGQRGPIVNLWSVGSIRWGRRCMIGS